MARNHQETDYHRYAAKKSAEARVAKDAEWVAGFGDDHLEVRRIDGDSKPWHIVWVIGPKSSNWRG